MTPQRDLLFFEKYNACRNRLGFYNNFHVTAKYSKKITPTLLSNALKVLLKHNFVFTLTHAKMAKDDNRPVANDLRFTPAESLLFDDLVDVVDVPFDESQLLQINNRSLRTYYPDVTWKLILFNNNYLTLYTNHVALDGESAREFHREMVKIFSEIETSELTHQQIVYTFDPESFEMPPKNTDVFGLYHCSKWEMGKFVVQEMIPKSLMNLYNYYFTEGFPNYTKNPIFTTTIERTPASLYKLIHIDSKTMTDFLNVLKLHDITLTPFLDILINYCFHQTILKHENPDVQFSVKSHIVVSGRKLYPELLQQLKFQSTYSACVFYVPPVNTFDVKNMVQLLKLYNKLIQDTLENRTQFKWASALTLLDPYDILRPEHPTVEQEVLFEISNLGFNKLETGDWLVEDLVFSQTVGTSCCFGFSCASTLNGMNISLGYLEKFAVYPVNELVELLVGCIEKVASQGKGSEE